MKKNEKNGKSFSDLETFASQGVEMCQAHVLEKKTKQKSHQYFAFCFLLIMFGFRERSPGLGCGGLE